MNLQSNRHAHLSSFQWRSLLAKGSLHRQNVIPLVGVVVADSVLLFMLLNGWEISEETSTRLIALRAITSLIAGTAVLLLAGFFPAGLKDVLVFWRFRDVLPGHRAFSDRTLSDPRIDTEKLRRNITFTFPAEAREQNSAWYRLFKKVEAEGSVEHCNHNFLLFRELAAISALATVISIGLSVIKPNMKYVTEVATIVFALQYLLAAISSANYGRRLVTTVLAAHSVKRR